MNNSQSLNNAIKAGTKQNKDVIGYLIFTVDSLLFQASLHFQCLFVFWVQLQGTAQVIVALSHLQVSAKGGNGTSIKQWIANTYMA